MDPFDEREEEEQSEDITGSEQTSPPRPYLDPSPNPDHTLDYFWRIPDVRDAIIHHARLIRSDLLELENIGVRAQVTDNELRVATGRNEVIQCNSILDFAQHPRGALITGEGRCPHTDITQPRVSQCSGALRHGTNPPQLLHVWPHEPSIFTILPMEPLVSFLDGRRHPRGGSLGIPRYVCLLCIEQFEALVEHQLVNRLAIADHWVPYCERHSQQYSTDWDMAWPEYREQKPIACRCFSDMNSGWKCWDHRIETLMRLTERARYHKEYLRKWHSQPPRVRPLSRWAKKKRPKKTLTPNAAADRREKDSCYFDPDKEKMKKWPGCPSHRCPRPSWTNATEPRRRIAKCLGCGGLVRCTGKLGRLKPVATQPWGANDKVIVPRARRELSQAFKDTLI